MTSRTRPVVLSIAGSDSGGGAGIQADLKAITAMGGWGATAITCLTAQNLEGVRAIQATEASVLRDQIDAVCEAFDVRAAKTGMLYSRELIAVTVERLLHHRPFPLVVDPVMVATSGARLLEEDAVAAMRDNLLPIATLATPNLHEAALLAGREVTDLPGMRRAAEVIHRTTGARVLVKGGHLGGEAVDVLYDGTSYREYRADRVESGTAGHGTGCTLASAIATALALGSEVHEAVALAKDRLTRALGDRVSLGRGIEAMELFPG
jgi:hydroxymethylpyrimidine kinase/phosphomethylpyrimidine kinase